VAGYLQRNGGWLAVALVLVLVAVVRLPPIFP
jgi:hypothetical protein